MSLTEMIIWRTYCLARKILEISSPIVIVRRMAINMNGEWVVKGSLRHQTDYSRKRLTSRDKRLWSMLSIEEQRLDLKSKPNFIKLKKKVYHNWITIGKTILKIEIFMIIETIIIIEQARAELSNSQKQLKTNLMK